MDFESIRRMVDVDMYSPSDDDPMIPEEEYSLGLNDEPYFEECRPYGEEREPYGEEVTCAEVESLPVVSAREETEQWVDEHFRCGRPLFQYRSIEEEGMVERSTRTCVALLVPLEQFDWIRIGNLVYENPNL